MFTRKDFNLLLINLTVFLDVLGYSIVLPILSYLCESLNGDSFHRSLLFTGYAAMQLISYLYMGRVSDRYGRKSMIILSLIGSSFGALAQGYSKTIWSLIITRAITGLFAGSWIVAQAAIADSTNVDERPKYLARLEAFLAAAYIFGPAIGGFLGQIALNVPLYVAGFVALIALIVVCFTLQETLPSSTRKLKQIQTKADPSQTDKKPKLSCSAKYPLLVIFCMFIEFWNRWIINGWDSYFAAYANEEYNLTSFQFSILVTCLGCLSCVINGFLYPIFLFKCQIPISYLAIIGGCFQTIGQLTIGLGHNKVTAIIGSLLMEMGYNFSTPAPASIISSHSDSSCQGEVLSTNMMVGQIAMIFAPLVVERLSHISSATPFFVSSCSGAFVIICMGVIMYKAGIYVGTGTKELPVKKSSTEVIEESDDKKASIPMDNAL